jgi:hypothetical protein
MPKSDFRKIQPKAQQVKSINTTLAKTRAAGYDTHAHVDSRLTRSENLRNIQKLTGTGTRHRGLEEFQQQTAEAKRARALRKQPLRQTSVSNEHFDLMYQAMRPGKRFSASGHRYYERRSNRTDKNPSLRI